jgi:hypothetical protein
MNPSIYSSAVKINIKRKYRPIEIPEDPEEMAIEQYMNNALIRAREELEIQLIKSMMENLDVNKINTI